MVIDFRLIITSPFVISYQENNNIGSCGILGTSKMKVKQLKRMKHLIQSLCQAMYFGLARRIRLVGRGYKIYPDLNTVSLKLGYCHMIFYTLPLSITFFKKEKKNYFFTFHGINYSIIQMVFILISESRIPNIYSKKGIFKQHEKIKFKQGKKAFSL